MTPDPKALADRAVDDWLASDPSHESSPILRILVRSAIQRALNDQQANAEAGQKTREHEVKVLSADKARLDWLAAHPLETQIKGGSDDGHVGIFWGIGAHSGTLRETIDAAMRFL